MGKRKTAAPEEARYVVTAAIWEVSRIPDDHSSNLFEHTISQFHRASDYIESKCQTYHADMTSIITEKWGFGMAPPKPATQRERMAACRRVMALLNTLEMPKVDEQLLDQLSVIKGMFNRIAREDQWDWFTVSGQFGYPSNALSKAIAEQISELRSAIRDGDDTAVVVALTNLLRLPTRQCLSVFLGLKRITDEANAGWIYILSTRELKDLLKIGVTTRTVETRANEINGATGVAIPFGVRRCWRVLAPRRAEKLIHEALHSYRIRNDREFFRIEFTLAAQLTHKVVKDSGLEIRTLNALASLGS